MIEHARQKIMENPVAQDTLQGALAVGMTATGTAGLAGKIELANNIMSVCLSVVGAAVGIATFIHIIYKIKQSNFNYKQSVKYDGEDRRKP